MNQPPDKRPPATPAAANEPPSENAPAEQQMTARETYNVVSDTLTGVNIRKRDNLFQAVFILLAVLAGAGLGAILAKYNDWSLPWYGGALVGGFAGLVLGFFTSGIFLMIYRGIRHSKGKHD